MSETTAREGSFLRHTVIAHGRHAMRERRLDAARQRQHGLHILTFEQLAARLAGGLTCSVDEETLRQAVQAALPTLSLGELDSLKSLPGMVAAAVDTISKVWSAGIDLQQRAASHSRLASIATLEAAVLAAFAAGHDASRRSGRRRTRSSGACAQVDRTGRGRRPHRTCALLASSIVVDFSILCRIFQQ